jgi:cell division transport system permease protein
MAATDPWGGRSRRGIRAWVRDHWRLALDSSAFISARLGTSLLVWLLIGIALALPAGLYLVRSNLAALADQWQGRPGLTVYFETATAVTVGRDLEREISDRAEVERVELTTPEAALAEFQAFAGIEDALELLEVNPLPMSLGVILAEGVEASELELLASQLSTRDGVAWGWC